VSDVRLPNWAREVVTLLPACAHFLLSGNVYDQYFVRTTDENGRERATLLSLPRLLAGAFRDSGVETTVGYEITRGAFTIPPGNTAAAARAERILGERPADIAPSRSLRGLGELISRVAAAAEPVALVIGSASRLVRDVTQLSDEEFDFYRHVDAVARDSQPPARADSERMFYNPVVWVLDSDRDVPRWFALRNEALRSIVLPLPDAGERRELAGRLVPGLDGGAPTGDLAAAAKVLAEQTASMTLTALNRTVAIARDQGLGPERVEDAARSYRVGVTDNPWRASYLTDRLRSEVAALDEPAPGGGRAGQKDASLLRSRVLGQEVAIRKAFDILVRSATGLTAAHAQSSATRPRGVLFFAGPTGVGKTELAKALTRLLFDDERFYIRFDMSEFSAEHAADRLIGAPPGYVGHDSGGELTNAVRQRPFSLILFDEIEKAHPRILDKFLQLLDDGRLTDGQGETVYFTESVIVFTSNLGVYSDTEESDGMGGMVRVRRPTADRATVSYAEMTARIEAAIRQFFVLELGRPELLNRIGDNIVVFDYIDAATGQQILGLMMRNVIDRIRQEHQLTLRVSDKAMRLLETACLSPDALQLGGRGIGSILETALVNPLANAIFRVGPRPGAAAELDLSRDGDQWTAHLTPA
jgi:energy-coupling factor transporter ATP-binding protein EcfA2